MSGAGGPIGNQEDIGRAMEVMGLVLGSEALVRRYTDAPAEAFETAREGAERAELVGARYEDIPEPVRSAFEAMSLRELLFLASFGATLESAGMYIDVPGVGKCAIK